MGLGTWGIGVMENWSLGAGGTGTHLCRKLNRKLRREFGGWGSTRLRTKLTPKGMGAGPTPFVASLIVNFVTCL